MIRISHTKVGDRVLVQTKELNKVKGEVAFYGEGDFAPGKWIGVRLDDPGTYPHPPPSLPLPFESFPNPAFRLFAPGMQWARTMAASRVRSTSQPRRTMACL